jgi:hypothetical protein
MRILECQENRSDGRLLTALQNASCRLGGVILIFTSDGFANMHGGPSVSGPVLCSQCDQPEEKCGCEKYCCYCQSQQGVRLCIDGLYYCPDCREACDVRAVDARGE